MLGFDPIPSSNVKDKSLLAVNKYLDQYRSLHGVFDGWLVIGLTSIDLVYLWRESAEKSLRTSGKGGMTEKEVKDFRLIYACLRALLTRII